MKIGDRVYVHGYIDEIRKDVVIIRNSGGYFGTVKSEIIVAEKKKNRRNKNENRIINSGRCDTWRAGDILDRKKVKAE